MELADIVVTRGGANTIFELLAMAKLHLIVPWVVKQVEETRLKMRLTCEKGYAEELQESDLTLSTLEEKVSKLLTTRRLPEHDEEFS